MEIKYLVLVIYDIIDNRRRYYFSKLLESYLIRVQKSAFEGVLSKSKYNELLKIIDNNYNIEDNIRIYKIDGSSSVNSFPCDEYLEDDILSL